MNRLRAKSGFTLVELLVTVAVIAVLASLLLPSLGSARQLAKRMACASNLRQIHNGSMMYATDNNSWMPPENVNGNYLIYVDAYLNAKGRNSCGGTAALYFTTTKGFYFCPGTPNSPSDSPCWSAAGGAPVATIMSVYNPTVAMNNPGGGWHHSGSAPYRRMETITNSSVILSESNFTGVSGGLTKTALLWQAAYTVYYPSTSNNSVPAFNYHLNSANFVFLEGSAFSSPYTGRQLFNADWQRR